jgi:pimeloyl-ACP methyl ester carboxylesterase
MTSNVAEVKRLPGYKALVRRPVAIVVGTVAVALIGLIAPSSTRAGATGGPPTLTVGSQVLDRCGQAWCGKLQVPLDWAYPTGPTITIDYRWYPATDKSSPALGTIVPVEGGPGYPSIGSVELDVPGGYAAMYGPLLAHRNLLAIDLRGTGSSANIDCKTLQKWATRPAGTPFDLAAEACADSIDRHYGTTTSSPFLASSEFSSAEAADDVAAIIKALETGPVDLYGDSYGSFFAQTFASRFPALIRSVILDSTYQIRGLDPWYQSSVAAFRQNFSLACSRSVACAASTPDGWSQIVKLAASLRSHPVSGVVPDGHGHLEPESMGIDGLVNLVNDAAEDPTVYRELDGAAETWLRAGDAAPLLRLYAERFIYDENYFNTPSSGYSGGLYLADSCVDYPQLFSMATAPANRAAQLQSAVAKLPTGTFSPFTTQEWLDQDQNTENYTACLDWPTLRGATRPAQGLSTPFLPPSTPVLILGGELDGWTPPAGVPAVQSQLGGQSRFIVMANSTHVVGEGDRFGCATSLIRQFVENPSDLDDLDAACAAAVPAIHVVGEYPSVLSAQTPLSLRSGTSPGKVALELAGAAVDTAGDALARYGATTNASDVGLHGGTVKVNALGDAFRLDGDQLVPGVAVSGSIEVAPDGLSATAQLTSGQAGETVTLTAKWSIYGAGAQASVHASYGYISFTGTTPAP